MLTIDTIPLCQFWILDLGFSIARETLFFQSKIQNPQSKIDTSPALPISPSPHFLFHGPTPEHYHITKPLVIDRRPRRSRYDDFINMYLNPAYGKYLKGE